MKTAWICRHWALSYQGQGHCRPSRLSLLLLQAVTQLRYFHWKLLLDMCDCSSVLV